MAYLPVVSVILCEVGDFGDLELFISILKGGMSRKRMVKGEMGDDE